MGVLVTLVMYHAEFVGALLAAPFLPDKNPGQQAAPLRGNPLLHC